MPTLRACTNALVTGCRNLTPRSKCSDCERADERERNLAPHRRIYSTWAWKQTRLERFRMDDFTCVDCGWHGEAETGEGLHGDHEPDLLELLDRGLSPFDVEHVRTRCHSCHSKKTASVVWGQ